MPATMVKSDGGDTIPESIREYLRIGPDDQVEFVIDPQGRVLVVPARVPVERLRGCLPKPERPVSLEEMEEAIASGMAGEEEP